MNRDIEKERKNSTIDLEKMTLFLGKNMFGSVQNYKKMMNIRDQMVAKIKPIYEENFYNLDRDEKYQMIFKKSLEIFDFARDNNLNDIFQDMLKIAVLGSVLGAEKFLFTLHTQAFKVSIDLWGTDQQVRYWNALMNNKTVIGTYIQTEIGHGTYVRGLETTATFDKNTKEFIIDSPTLTSIKFWPGTGGITANFGIVMAKLIIDNKDHGVQAFVVQLRSFDHHKNIPGIETGDIGKKGGFESHDNGYIKFDKVRIPLFNMLMKNAVVTEDGKFEKIGSELIMYACMLLLRGSLCIFGSTLLSLSTTIAIRYSSIRRQTANLEGEELQIMDYQTQQYRLFQGLATTYSYLFSANFLVDIIKSVRKSTNNFILIQPNVLAKLHAISAGLKAQTFNNCLKFAQINRLCCGGHGYSSASGLIPIIQEADAGCTYEGDNIVLLLQTARYLLKCAQKNVSPHYEFENINQIKQSNLYKYFESYIQFYYKLYDEMIGEVSNRMLYLVNEASLNQFDAWNECTVQLVNTAKIYISIFVINCSFISILSCEETINQQALCELFETFMLYDIVEDYSAHFLRFNVIDANQMKEFTEKLYSLLKKVRLNAVSFVDSFNYLDSNLCSALGAYDGNAYEKLFDFARKSKFNEKDVHDGYHKYLKPYFHRQKLYSKL